MDRSLHARRRFQFRNLETGLHEIRPLIFDVEIED